MNQGFTRRGILNAGSVAAALGAMGTLSSQSAHAFGGTGPVAYLDLGQEATRPRALESLVRQVRDNTSSKILEAVGTVRPSQTELFDYPLVYAGGAEAVGPLQAQEKAALRLYLEQGGTLLIDDTSGRQDSPFAQSLRGPLLEVLSGRQWFTLDPDLHAVYRSFFHLHRTAGRVMVRPYLEGLNCGDITSVILSRNDLAGAWETDQVGLYSHAVQGGRTARAEAIKLGINLVVFAMTGNYKTDAVHVNTLLRNLRERRRGF